jgi:Uma2 family endonuclease
MVTAQQQPEPAWEVIRKREEYAAAAISEYWIVDSLERQITVLHLDSGMYIEHGVFAIGERAVSRLVAGFEVGVRDVFAAAEHS